MEKDKTRFKEFTVGAVVLNYNGGEDVLKCTQALFQQEVHLEQVILVDNGSTDNSSQIVKEKFPDMD